MEKVFSNIGGKIKVIAKVNLIVGIIGVIICAFEFGMIEVPEFYGYYSYTTKTELTFLFWVFLLVGPIVIYIESMILYGFGELIESTSISREALTNMQLNPGTPMQTVKETVKEEGDDFDDPALHF